MPRNDEVVKRLEAARELGFGLPEAVMKMIGTTLTAWAESHGHRQSEVSMCLGGYPGRPYASIRDDLAQDLGIERTDLDRLIDGDPTPAPAEEVA